MGNNLLTMVLMTHNRPQLLSRALRFYSPFSYPLLVMDSSEKSNHPLVGLYGNDQTVYEHCSDCGYRDLITKLKRAVALVKTPYMVFVTDDDFTLEAGLAASLDFLEAHADYTACYGYTMLYIASAGKVLYTTKDVKGVEDFNLENPAERIHAFMSHYLPPFYAIIRTGVQRNWFERVPPEFEWDYLELGQAFHLLTHGKVRVLPVPYAVRDANYPATEHQSNLLTALVHPDWAGEKRERIFDFLAAVFMAKNPAVDFHEARRIAGNSVLLLAKCLIAGTSLAYSTIFSSTRPTIGGKVEWAFTVKQFLELPFYTTAFFDVLEKIDFLLYAMPVGKYQIQTLQPLLTVQNEIVAKAVLLKEGGNTPLALDSVSQVLTANPFHLEAACLLTELYVAQGDLETAANLRQWVLRIDSTRPEVRNLGRLF